MPFKYLRAPRTRHEIAENEARHRVAMALRVAIDNCAAWTKVEEMLVSGYRWSEIQAALDEHA